MIGLLDSRALHSHAECQSGEGDEVSAAQCLRRMRRPGSWEKMGHPGNRNGAGCLVPAPWTAL